MTKTNPDQDATPERRKIALALQGGGSHGAFAWGVLDRLIEETRFDIIGVTGTSAGAMNAVVLADGLVAGGSEQARRQLRRFWETVGKMPGFASFLWPMSGKEAAEFPIELTPASMAWEMLSHNLSPYDLNPIGFNPLRAPIEELVDFDRLRTQEILEVMVCATNARTARRRVFTKQDLSVDAVLASACLPYLFTAIEIEGDPYWDGGYTGNPAMTALMRRMPSCDLIIVRIDPIVRQETPRSVRDIHDRLVEISFNATFWLELSALGVILTFVDEGLLDPVRFGRFRFHAIEANQEMEKFPMSSKRNNYPAFLEYLFNLGRQSAHAWLGEHAEALGRRSTIDLRKLLPVGI